MITKKEIPLNLLKLIEPIAQENLDLIKLKKEDGCYYSFIECDEQSKNYFKIYIDGKSLLTSYINGNIVCEYKPANRERTGRQLFQAKLGDISSEFKAWLEIIRETSEFSSIHDDDFAKKYSEYYFQEFKILDADAEISPFNPEQQKHIESYLLSLCDAIKDSKNEIDDDKKREIILEINEIKKQLPLLTKNEVTRRVSKIFGKLYSISSSIAKEIVKEAKSQLIKKLVSNGIKYAPKLLELFS